MIAFITCLLATLSFSATYTEGDFTYNIVNSRATLQSARCPSAQTELRIPEYVTYQNKQYPVYQIYQECFKDCSNWIGSVNIPPTVISIGRSSFENCVNLNGELHLHDKITIISARAFYGCSNLKYPNQDIISLPPIATLNEYLFYGCSSLSANSFQLPPAITRINQYAFYGCSSLKGALIIPDTVTVINNYAFYHCTGFTSLSLPNRIATIGECAFSGCSGFTGDMTFATTGRLSIGNSAFSGCTGLDGELTIYGTPNSIGTNAFQGLTNLKKINYYGSSISGSPTNVFDGSSLNNIEICSTFDGETFFSIEKTNINQINDFIFEYDTAYRNARVKNGICAFLAGKNDIPTRTNYNDEEYPVTSLGQYSFALISMSKTLSIPSGITTIEREAFYGSSGLHGDLVIPNTVNTIGDFAFFGTGFAGTLKLSGQLHQIGNNAFQSLRLTGSLTIPSSVEIIGDFAFASISTLNGRLVFEAAGTSASCLKKISNSAFYSCSKLVGDINIPDSVTEIGSKAFSGCTGFNGVVHLPSNLRVISEGAFQRCRNVVGNLNIPEGVTTIGPNAFSSCGFDGNLIIPETVTTIGDSAFMSCRNFIGDLRIPSQITELNNQVFSDIGCNGTLFLPPNLRIIGDRSLQITKFKQELKIPSSVTYIGSEAFQRSLFYGNLELPLGVTEIGLDAFSNCEGFNDVFSFGDKIESFPERLFQNTPISSINYYGASQISDCRIFNGMQVTVNVLVDYQTNTFCSRQVNKVLVIQDPDQQPSQGDGEIKEIQIEDDAASNIVQEKLIESFDGMTGSNKVVVIDSSKINFDHVLQDDQFIKPISGSNINFIGGNLNLALSSNKNIVVTLHKQSGVNLAIKGEGDIEIDYPEGIATKSIDIAKRSQINGSVTITVPDVVDSVSIDSIDLESSSSIAVKKKGNGNQPVSLTVKNIAATYNTEASISDLTIQNTLKLIQTASLNINNVNMDGATIQYEIFNFDSENSGWKNPLLSGRFSNPPSSFVLRKIDGEGQSSPTVDADYVLISGMFEDDKCNEWLNKIDFQNSGFNSRSCVNNNQLLDAKNQRIVIKTTKEDEKQNNKKLSGGQIAGIVIGCVAGVAIIVIIIVVVIKKRNPKSINEDENGASEQVTL